MPSENQQHYPAKNAYHESNSHNITTSFPASSLVLGLEHLLFPRRATKIQKNKELKVNYNLLYRVKVGGTFYGLALVAYLAVRSSAL